MYDCVMLVLICVKKPETKGLTSRGKITDDLVVQNNLLVDIAITYTVLYFAACNQDSQSESRKLINMTRSNGNCTWTEFSVWGWEIH